MKAFIGKKPCGHIAAAWIADGTEATHLAVGQMFDNDLIVSKIETKEPIRVQHCECANLIKENK